MYDPLALDRQRIAEELLRHHRTTDAPRAGRARRSRAASPRRSHGFRLVFTR